MRILLLEKEASPITLANRHRGSSELQLYSEPVGFPKDPRVSMEVHVVGVVPGGMITRLNDYSINPQRIPLPTNFMTIMQSYPQFQRRRAW